MIFYPFVFCIHLFLGKSLTDNSSNSQRSTPRLVPVTRDKNINTSNLNQINQRTSSNKDNIEKILPTINTSHTNLFNNNPNNFTAFAKKHIIHPSTDLNTKTIVGDIVTYKIKTSTDSSVSTGQKSQTGNFNNHLSTSQTNTSNQNHKSYNKSTTDITSTQINEDMLFTQTRYNLTSSKDKFFNRASTSIKKFKSKTIAKSNEILNYSSDGGGLLFKSKTFVNNKHTDSALETKTVETCNKSQVSCSSSKNLNHLLSCAGNKVENSVIHSIAPISKPFSEEVSLASEYSKPNQVASLLKFEKIVDANHCNLRASKKTKLYQKESLAKSTETLQHTKLTPSKEFSLIRRSSNLAKSVDMLFERNKNITHSGVLREKCESSDSNFEFIKIWCINLYYFSKKIMTDVIK